jgi:hypothetical protein
MALYSSSPSLLISRNYLLHHSQHFYDYITSHLLRLDERVSTQSSPFISEGSLGSPLFGT